MPSRAPSRAASTWSNRRGNGLGPEWQCRSTRPCSTRSIAGVAGIGDSIGGF
jgi:hypothetical protein